MNYEQLIQGNEAFIQKMKQQKPDFFEELQKGQTPDFFVLSCSDSRSDPDTITSSLPGKLFVHRNVANQVVEKDDSLRTGLYYAMRVLQIKGIIILGHTGCGGVQAARQGVSNEHLDDWLGHVETSIRGIDELQSDDHAHERQNIRTQIENIKELPVYQDIGKGIPVLGALFHLENGKIEWID
ncbi:carbonic anhydrase [Salisediminibacterium beveridgei]|uniref:carbonic anhydrase n=1 Tax=Salisediminibacterium beveridgei TaxID=632773 RepID=A0A1D7QXF9_9BACI|nr:carbonic anhydrase [Salisediminibacterium beveridgei]AOM83701.1 Carbonic anhydrase [Salisediminibacterium beveridgei]